MLSYMIVGKGYSCSALSLGRRQFGSGKFPLIVSLLHSLIATKNGNICSRSRLGSKLYVIHIEMFSQFFMKQTVQNFVFLNIASTRGRYTLGARYWDHRGDLPLAISLIIVSWFLAVNPIVTSPEHSSAPTISPARNNGDCILKYRSKAVAMSARSCRPSTLTET